MLPRWNPFDIGPPYPVPLQREYELTVRQEPKQARMCGVGGKADRRPIDPPPIVQLRVIDPAQRNRTVLSNPNRDAPKTGSSPDPGSTATRPNSPGATATSSADSTGQDAAGNSSDLVPSYADSYLQNPYYFMFASLAKPDDDAELHWLKDGRTRCTTGSVVSSLYHLKDPHNHNEDAGFFVFPDLSVRTEGSYRLKLSLFEVVDNSVRHCKSIFSAPFYVYTAKKFPGMEESTPLSCSLADQGIKIRIRKDIRVRKRPMPALEHPLGPAGGAPSFAPGGSGPLQPLGPVPGTLPPQSATASPHVPITGTIPPPPGASMNIPPAANTNTSPPGVQMTIPPPPGATMTMPSVSNSAENAIQLPIPQPNPHGGLSLPGVDRRTLPMPSAPGIGKGVVIEEAEERPPATENARRRNDPSRRANNADNMDEDDDDEYHDEGDDDDDDYREYSRTQNIGRRNPSTRQRKSTSKRKELERKTTKTKGKTAAEEEDELLDDDDSRMILDQESSNGRSASSDKAVNDKKNSKGREAKRQKRGDNEAGNATNDNGTEVQAEPVPALAQHQQQRQYHYPPPIPQWGPPPPTGPTTVDPALQSTSTTPSQNGTDVTNGNGVVYDGRYQQPYYDASQSQQPQTQSYQMYPHYAPPVHPPNSQPHMYPPYAPVHPPYYQPGVQTWAPPPPPSMSYPPPLYGPPPSTSDPYANSQHYPPRYDYAAPPPSHPHSIYGPPPGPMQHYPGYYEQAPSHAAPMPPQQQQQQQYATPSAPAPNPAPSEGSNQPRAEYGPGPANVTPQGARSVSPSRYPTMSSQQQVPSHPHPPAHHMHAPPQHPYYQPMPLPPQHYPAPYNNMYGMYPPNAPVPSAVGAEPWGTPAASNAGNWQGNANGEGYPTPSQHQAFNQPVMMQNRSQQMQQPSVGPADRIQLAPLRVGTNVNTSSPTASSSATSGGISPTVSSASAAQRSAGSEAFPVIRLRSGSRSGAGYANSSLPSREHGEHDREVERTRREERGKKNPLSIGNIISDETN